MRCNCCHHHCDLADSTVGLCGTKTLKLGSIEDVNRGTILAKALDPIEKKPLFHFFPGSRILSVGTFGCNLRCPWCQNWSLVAARPQLSDSRINLIQLAEDLIEEAKSVNAIGIAFTYNEPLMWHETVLEIARAFKAAGLRTVMVSNGCASERVVARLVPWIDAWNIDLKTTSPQMYSAIGGSLDSVLTTIRSAVDYGAHVELTTLIVPDFNDTDDDFKSLAALAGSLKVSVLHLTRYFPTERYPLPATPEATMQRGEAVVRERIQAQFGFDGPSVYLGNCSWADLDTYCKSCGHKLAQRSLRPVSCEGQYCMRCGEKSPFVL